MSKVRLAAVSAVAVVAACVSLAGAADISAKKIYIKDSTDPAKRQIAVQSADIGVTLAGADDPGTNGAALHVYSATDDFCAILPGGLNWKSKPTSWQYKNSVTKNGAQVKAGKLSFKIKSGVTYTLMDNGTQGIVNVAAQFGSGTRYCMRCTGNKKDTATKFLGKDCVAAACAPEPSSCMGAFTTTTTTTSTTTSTTCLAAPGSPSIVIGSLTPTPGRFNYNLQVGLPAANNACNTHFPGTHACTVQELQNAAAAGDLPSLRDTSNNLVMSFWAIDPMAPALSQCVDDNLGGSGLNWEYPTAHTASRGQLVTLNSCTGALGMLQTNLQCNFSQNWVGCCQ